MPLLRGNYRASRHLTETLRHDLPELFLSFVKQFFEFGYAKFYAFAHRGALYGKIKVIETLGLVEF